MLYRIGLAVFVPQSIQVRGMATLKDISIRLKSIKNIQKITKSMKMVSAAKFARAERELRPARPYGIGAADFYKKADIHPEGETTKQLIIAISSDRGLCGGIHSGVAKVIKAELAEKAPGIEAKVIPVGDKSRGILERQYKDHILMSFVNVGKKPPTFMDAAYITQSIMDTGYEFETGVLHFNRFKSVVSFKPIQQPIYSLETVSNAPGLNAYDSLDGEVLRSYHEFSLASLMFYAMKENSTAEQSSRMTAMDAATKNAGEMIDKLTLTFNRTRQAVITRELIEIISGAAALKEQH